MPSARALIGGIVQRLLPGPTLDDIDADKPMRIGRYREQYSLSLVRKAHLLADEGSYFVTNNAQTGLAAPTPTAFTATNPIATISNTDAVTAAAKRVYLDYVTLVTTAAGSFASGAVALQLAIYLDTGDRYSSGGTDLSANIVSPNMDGPSKSSVVKVRFGNVTATAATGAARAVVGLRTLRPDTSTTADIVGEQKVLNFGPVEQTLNGSITIANANNIPLGLPPVIIGPQQCALIYFIMNGTTPAAPSYAPEFGWWER
jgi:hypothetical protein